MKPRVTRRGFLHAALAAGGGLLPGCSSARSRTGATGGGPAAPGSAAPAAVTAEGARPRILSGVQSGDVTDKRAVIWSRSDRSARMVVEWSASESFQGATRVEGPTAGEDTDFTAKVDLDGLPPGEPVFYRVTFEDGRAKSEPAVGRLRTAPIAPRDLLVAWSGDTAGQGWGINPAWGGMRMYETMRRHAPDLFIHCGDLIYADIPIHPKVRLDDGSVWTNLVTPEKSKVAETLADLRGNFRYNLLDDNVRRFNAEVAQLVMWDDHETHNNWYPGQLLRRDRRYKVKLAGVIAERARRAMFEYTPIRAAPDDPGRIYRSFRYGPSLEVFLLDERSYRGQNSTNRQEAMGPATAFLGAGQLQWLERGLAASTATWKLVAADQPLGLVIAGDIVRRKPQMESWSNGPGPPLGRELELAALLAFLKERKVKNVVWVTADVHYAAAHRYDPVRSVYGGFDPFWEFVAGPLHAGAFGPNPLDPTFGPEVRFMRTPPHGNPPPSDGLLSFGTLRIDGKSEVMTVSLRGLDGASMFDLDLVPER